MMEFKKIWGVVLFAVPLALGSREEFERQVCLETAMEFGFSKDACKFKDTEMNYWFNDSTEGFSCKKECTLYTYLDSNSPLRAKHINMFLNTNNVPLIKLNFHWIRCHDNLDRVPVIVYCPWTAFQDYFGLLCTSNTDCLMPNTTCSIYGLTGMCTCDDGFVGVDGDCKAVATSTTDYQVSTTNPETQQLLQDSESGQAGSSAGTVAGVGLGDLVFRVVVSLSIVFIIRKRDSLRKQFSESRNTAVNVSYDTETERIEAHQDRDVPNTKQVSHVRPTVRDTPYSNVKCFSENDNGDIYNHLHEKEDPGADLDDYDHAHTANEHGVPDEDYSHLRSLPERGMESQQNDDVYDRATSIDDHDNYFTLERKSDLS